MQIAAKSETAILSTDTLQDDDVTQDNDVARTLSKKVSSIRPAYLSGHLVAVKDIKKQSITLTKKIITEVNQVHELNIRTLVCIIRNEFFLN